MELHFKDLLIQTSMWRTCMSKHDTYNLIDKTSINKSNLLSQSFPIHTSIHIAPDGRVLFKLTKQTTSSDLHFISPPLSHIKYHGMS